MKGKQSILSSSTDRQNVLNNKFAVKEIQEAIDFRGIEYEGKYLFTKSQIARYLEVSERTIDNYLEKFSEEIRKNGYEVFTGKRLQDLKKQLGNENNFVTKTTQLAFFDFKSFLNLTMLIAESAKARSIRQVILDIVIDVINQKAGGNTKFINQRDENYIIVAFQGEKYRKEFTDALKDFVDMGKAKYPIYTNKVYDFVFKEKSREYRRILRLASGESVRDTMYSAVLDIIASFEAGFAEEVFLEYKRLGRKLSPQEVDEMFVDFCSKKHWDPLLATARRVMASRDHYFRKATHEKLSEYIGSLSPEEFERFLGEKSKSLATRIEEYQEVFKRLSNK